jgi:hypothetical protein
VIIPEVHLFGGEFILHWRGRGKQNPQDPLSDLALFSLVLSKQSQSHWNRPRKARALPLSGHEGDVHTFTNFPGDSKWHKLPGSPDRLGFPNKPKGNKISVNSRGRIQLWLLEV